MHESVTKLYAVSALAVLCFLLAFLRTRYHYDIYRAACNPNMYCDCRLFLAIQTTLENVIFGGSTIWACHGYYSQRARRNHMAADTIGFEVYNCEHFFRDCNGSIASDNRRWRYITFRAKPET